MRVLDLPYDRVVVSEDLTAKRVKALYNWIQCPITLSPYIPENHMTLCFEGKFVATINIEPDFDPDLQ